MKILIYLSFFIVFSFLSKGQNIKNVIYNYQDRNGFECKSQLFINGKTSIYSISDNRTSGTNESINKPGDFYKIYNDKWSKIFFKNGNKSIIRVPLFGKDITYEYPDDNFDLKMLGRTKKIGKYNCQEVKIKKGGRNYFAWFTTEIPLTGGPYGIDFLPGLVLELTEENTDFKITLSSISNTADIKKYSALNKFILSKKNKSFSEYNKDIIDIMTKTKKQNYVIMAESGATLNYNEDQSHFTQHLVDIPEGLVAELQKITQ